MIDEETRKYIVLFRLEGIRLDWSVFYAMEKPSRREKRLAACRSGTPPWDYYRKTACYLLTDEMRTILRELEQ